MYQEVFVILTVVTTSQFVAARNNETLPKPHVIIVGPTGAGKSSLACALTGGDPTSDTCLFPVCHDMDSCTKNTSYCGNMTWIGDESNPLFTVVDTPGFQDSDDQMGELIEEMTDVLNNDVKTADVVLLTIPEDTTRFTTGLIDMLKQLEMLFGRKMWNSTMIEISKFSYDPDDIEDREEDCEEDPDECRDEAFFYYEINRELEKNFHLGMNLSMVFIDSYARKDSHLDDEVQQQHFLEETDKLWEFAKNTPEFKFKTVDEVLEENAIMRDEIICLNGIINDELNRTLEDMKQLKVRLDKETLERQENDSALQKYVTARLDQETLERQENDSALQKNVKDVTGELATEKTERENSDQQIRDDISGVDDRVDNLEKTVLRSCSVDSDCGENLNSCLDGWCSIAECTANEDCPSTKPICSSAFCKCNEYLSLGATVKDEGNSVGTTTTNSPEACGCRCDTTDNCNSFSFCNEPEGVVTCYLTDKILYGHEETKEYPSNCASYKKLKAENEF